MSSGGRGSVRLELETVRELAREGLLEVWKWARLRDDIDSGVLMGSPPIPACSALYLMLVYSRPTSCDFCSAASLGWRRNNYSLHSLHSLTFPLYLWLRVSMWCWTAR